MDLERLPFDVIAYLLSFLEPKGLVAVMAVSKTWEVSVISRNDRIWKRIFKKEMEHTGPGGLEKELQEKLDSFDNCFEKFRFLRSTLGYVFNKRRKCYVHPKNIDFLDFENAYKFSRRISDKVVNIKVVFVGEQESGKTCLQKRLCGKNTNEVQEVYIPTIFDNTINRIDMFKKEICLEYWDTAGHNDYSRLRPLSYVNADIFVYCFSLVDIPGLYEIPSKWFTETTQTSDSCARSYRILCGCKSDLREQQVEGDTSGKESSSLWDVPRREIMKVAKEIDALMYFETSAYKQSNDDIKRIVENLFYAFLIGKYSKKKDSNNNSKCCVM